MSRQHVLFRHADSLLIRRMHVMEPEVVADPEADIAVDVDAIASAIRDALEEAPVGLLTSTGLRHIREDRRARLRPAVVIDGDAVAVALALSVGHTVVWSAVSVGVTDPAQIAVDVGPLTRLLARDLTAAGDDTDSGADARGAGDGG